MPCTQLLSTPTSNVQNLTSVQNFSVVFKAVPISMRNRNHLFSYSFDGCSSSSYYCISTVDSQQLF